MTSVHEIGRRPMALMGLATALVLGACQTTAVDIGPDRPEPGLQGQPLADGSTAVLAEPYFKGVRRIGHAVVGGGRDSNVQMTWAGHCAYISSTGMAFSALGIKAADPALEGVAVIDVSDDRAPVQTALLRDPGAIGGSETMHAVQAADRSVLAVGAYAGGNPIFGADKPPYLELYDVSDCAHPKHMAEYAWPENVHTLTVSPNGRRVYGTHIDPFTGKGGIHVLDISDLAHPRYIGKFGATGANGETWEFATHEISLSPDETRIYAGVIGSTGGDLNADITTPLGRPSAARLANGAGGIYILDNSDVVEGRPDPKMRIIGTAQHAGWHSVMPANIAGVPSLVAAGELLACPGSWPKITSIADEAHPVVVGEFRLAMNHAENCPPPTPGESGSGGIVARLGTATIHFNDVDSPTDTRLGLFNFLWSGLRIVDIRNPSAPVEVAYFRPGDGCGGHVRYLPDSGDIWLSCAASGFHVLRLTPEVAAAVGRRR